MRKCQTAGIKLVFTIIGEPGLPKAIKAIMPGAIICYRLVYGTHDSWPFTTGQNGKQWLDQRWPEIAQVQGVDYWVLSNEWLDNRQPASVVQAFTDFYCQLIDACLERGIKCTVGDFSAGTPGWPGDPYEGHYLPILDKLFRKAEAAGFPVGWHLYDLLDQWGQRMPRAVSVARFRAYIEDYPNLIIIGTEGGNATKDGTTQDGMYRGEISKQYIMDFADLVWNDRQLWSINWWEATNPDLHRDNPEARWDLDDIFPILPWFFDWLISEWRKRNV